MCELVLRESSLLPHPNPGLMSAEWLRRLSRVAPSVGLMLETSSSRLLEKNFAHNNAPDKVPAKRLRVIEEAGQQNIPFTTGILIGIGETLEERVDSLLAIRELHETYGHVQEVIIQNFRAKPGTLMAHCPEPDRNDMLRTIAVAGPSNCSSVATAVSARSSHSTLSAKPASRLLCFALSGCRKIASGGQNTTRSGAFAAR